MRSPTSDHPKVFISYSHDSREGSVLNGEMA